MNGLGVRNERELLPLWRGVGGGGRSSTSSFSESWGLKVSKTGGGGRKSSSSEKFWFIESTCHLIAHLFCSYSSLFLPVSSCLITLQVLNSSLAEKHKNLNFKYFKINFTKYRSSSALFILNFSENKFVVVWITLGNMVRWCKDSDSISYLFSVRHASSDSLKKSASNEQWGLSSV